MKRTFAKAFALVLVLALTLSGCNLIEVDAKMQADEDIAKIDAKYSKVVASYAGGEITAAEAVGDFNSYYNEMAYMYQYYFGTDITEDEIYSMADEVLQSHVRAEITAAKYDEAGHAMEEADVAAMEDDIQYTYEQYLASAMESAEGKTDEAKAESARVILREFGTDYDALYANIQTSAKASEMEEILRAEITEVCDEELQAAFEAKVLEQEETYTDGSSFESAMTGEDEIVCWMPEGYRTVKHILVMPGDEAKSAYTGAVSELEAARSDLELLQDELASVNDDDLEGARSAEEIQAEIDAVEATLPAMEVAAAEAEAACLAEVQPTLDEIYARLAAGEDFEALIAEYGEDPGMQNEPTMSRGYYVSAASQNWEVNFRDAAMDLENVGDYTLQPVLSGSGVHIIQYTADVPAGTVDMESVREALTAETLTNLQDAHCEDTIAAWIEAAAPSYDVDGFLSVFAAE